MANYVLTYFGEPTFQSPEQGAHYKAKWMEWIGGLGAAVVTPTTPLRQSMTVTADGASASNGSDRVTGFTVVAAETMDDAVAMAQTCPPPRSRQDRGR